MKTILVALGCLAGVVFVPSVAAADCGCGGSVVTSSVVEGRPAIVVELSCSSPKKVPGFAIVDAGGTRIDVTVSASHVGYLQTIQYVLVPDAALAAGTYELVVSKAYGAGKQTFTVVAASSSASLAWAADPNVVSQRQTELGCGPRKRVEVALGDTSATHALVQLTDEKTKKLTTGYVRITDDKLSIGHGMCGGEFPLVKGRAYTATVSLLAPDTGAASAAKSVAFTYTPKTK
jgi:hypothetical protein